VSCGWHGLRRLRLWARQGFGFRRGILSPIGRHRLARFARKMPGSNGTRFA
jgi:hypothetical protein